MASNSKLSPEPIPDSKVHGANMGPTWVLSAPDGPHVGPMNLAIGDVIPNLFHYTASLGHNNSIITLSIEFMKDAT